MWEGFYVLYSRLVTARNSPGRPHAGKMTGPGPGGVGVRPREQGARIAPGRRLEKKVVCFFFFPCEELEWLESRV